MQIVGERAAGEGSGMVVIVMDLYVQLGMLLENLHIGLIYGMKSNYDVPWAPPSQKECNSSFALNQTILNLTKHIQKILIFMMPKKYH